MLLAMFFLKMLKQLHEIALVGAQTYAVAVDYACCVHSLFINVDFVICSTEVGDIENEENAL